MVFGIRLLPPFLLVLLLPLAASAGLVAHWRLDGDALDASGNGHTGTLVNAPVYVASQIGFGQALSFDGNLAQNVIVPDHPDFDFGTGDFSVLFWAKPDQNVGSGHGMVAKDSYGLEPSYGGWLFNEADALGGLGFQTRKLGVADTSARKSTRITPGTWGHLAATRGSGSLRLRSLQAEIPRGVVTSGLIGPRSPAYSP